MTAVRVGGIDVKIQGAAVRLRNAEPRHSSSTPAAMLRQAPASRRLVLSKDALRLHHIAVGLCDLNLNRQRLAVFGEPPIALRFYVRLPLRTIERSLFRSVETFAIRPTRLPCVSPSSGLRAPINTGVKSASLPFST